MSALTSIQQSNALLVERLIRRGTCIVTHTCNINISTLTHMLLEKVLVILGHTSNISVLPCDDQLINQQS